MRNTVLAGTFALSILGLTMPLASTVAMPFAFSQALVQQSGLRENPVPKAAAIKRTKCMSFDCVNRNGGKNQVNRPKRGEDTKRLEHNKHWMHVHSTTWNPRLHGKRYTHRYGKYRYYHGGYFYAWPWWYVRTIGYSHINWCRSHYRSYDQYTDTYIGQDGYRHRCRSPYQR